MPLLPKLSQLQSRLAASLIASVMLLMLYFAFSSPHFAYAADVDSKPREDHNHDRLLDRPFMEVDLEDLELREVAYEAQFLGYDRGIIGRAPTDNEPTALINNRIEEINIEQGQTVSYSFLNASVFGDPSPSTTGFPSPVRLRRRNTDWRDDQSDMEGASEQIGDDTETAPDLRLRPRQTTSGNYRTVYITVNACEQPKPILNTTVEPPPQLQLYVSLSQNNTNPGPGQDSTTQQMVTLQGGAGMITVNATGDVFIGLYGENTTAYEDVWNAQIAASIDAPYHYYHNGTDPNLFLVDSDSSSALLITGDLTDDPANSTVYQEWINSAPPFVLFEINSDDTSIQGLQSSYCGLLKTIGSTVGDAGIITRGDGQPKQQFYVDRLQSGSLYNAVLAMDGNSTNAGFGVVGGGGQVWPMTQFSTLTDGNCAVIFNLSFCDQTAYAVPGNPQTFPNTTSLAAFYDNATQAQYQIFQNVLAQIPCETVSSAQYSLARSCSDCAAAYKDWLCSVTIPRCTDFSSGFSWLRERNMVQPFPNGTTLPAELVSFAQNTLFLNSSRNPNIDQFVQPGPYKEILPCGDLCYGIVQSCPASMGFSCPRPGRLTFNQTYGRMPDPDIPDEKNQITCNYPGAAYYQVSGGSRISSPHILALVALVVMSLVFI